MPATEPVFYEQHINFHSGFWEYKWSYTFHSNSLHFL